MLLTIGQSTNSKTVRRFLLRRVNMFTLKLRIRRLLNRRTRNRKDTNLTMRHIIQRIMVMNRQFTRVNKTSHANSVRTANSSILPRAFNDISRPLVTR